MTSRSSSRSSPRAGLLRAVLCSILALAVPLFAVQKVRYTSYEWQVLKTAHFDIYYQKGNDGLGRYAADIAEYSHARISASLRFELTHTIPVFIYNGHNDFEDTTITWEVLTEGIGGFTEVYKNRVVVPYSGSLEEFRHVLMHEITHAFEYNVLYGDFWESLLTRPFIYSAPLWFMEGLAEYESLGEDPLSDMMLRDAVMNDMMPSVPDLENLAELPGFKYFFVYKGGQSFLNYIAAAYGSSKPGEILKAFRISKDMNNAFQALFGRGVEDLNREWMLYLRKKYWVDIGHQQLWDRKFTFLTHHFLDESFQNAKPVFAYDDKRLIFFSDARMTTEIVMADIAAPEQKKTLISSGLNANFEELHVSDNKMSISAGMKYLCFVSKDGRYDRINVWSFAKKRVIRRINPRMDQVFSAAWSPDASRLVFSAIRGGRTDLWACDASGANLVRLTDDQYFDVLPFWGNDGWIYFTSNRGRGVWSRLHDIYRLDPASGRLEPVVQSPASDSMAELSPDGRSLVFVSWRSGAPNLFVMNMSNRQVRQLTDVIGGVADPSWSSDARSLAFVFYNKMGQDIVTMPLDQGVLTNSPLATEFAVRTNDLKELPATIDDRSSERSRPAEVRITPDWVNFSLGYDPYYQFAGAAEFIFSDVLGHHYFGLNTSFYSGLGVFNFDLEYLYQRYRMNFGGAVFSVKDYYVSWNQDSLNADLYSRQQIGGYVTAQYPLDRFSLAEGRFSWVRQTLTSNTKKTVSSLSPVLTFTYDNTLWNGSTYIKGAMLYTEYEYGIPAGRGYWSFQRFILDGRYYLALSRSSSIAVRAVYASVWGRDANGRSFTVGGPGFVRGHKDSAYSGDNLALFKLEYRFPFVDSIRFAWPLPVVVRNLTGAIFWDFGAVWDDSETTRFGYVRRQTIYLDRLKSGLGIGFRMNLLYFKLLLDFATPFSGHSIRPLKMWQGALSIGYDF